MIEYQKISGPYQREVVGPNRNMVILGAWMTPEFNYLADLDWVFTEQVDGANIRIGWDGHRVEFGGRTDNAQIPAKLVDVLRELFPEELFEQAFGSNPAILFGEGYGAGIQKGGGNYRQDQSFVLFDVRVGDWWLKREDIEDVASKIGIDTVPILARCSLLSAIHAVASDAIMSEWGNFPAEGLVGTPAVPLFTRAGERIIVKVKRADFNVALRQP